MPYVHVSLSVPLTREECGELREDIAQLMPLLPNKNRDNTMIRIDSDCFIEMGEPGEPCVGVEIQLFHASPKEAKNSFVAAVTELMGKKFGVHPRRIYMRFIELQEWGTNGGLRS